jgi:MarR family transcriptional regulator, organic hydroperoxide resistance regulator
MAYDQLKLKNQLCFPVYAASRLIIREYQPYLDELQITYPQYLALMILWENDDLTVNEISNKLILNTNTVTPLLKRMEQLGLITRTRSGDDERKVFVQLSERGKSMQEKASEIPLKLASSIVSGNMQIDDLIDLKSKLEKIIGILKDKNISK